ncbi:MAG: zincribbon2 domain-containing protein [Nitrospira sp.]|nr:DUF2628 domain-containing protein [Nitrospira sp.]ULA59731.1 MAG: zincribbon2 domain-containing protein [Nitrospira sp.]
MKSCTQCRQENRDDARFCHQCGAPFTLEARAAAMESDQVAPQTDTELLKAFIGPNADRYLETFKKFSGPSGPQFALTWHWPAFLFEPFLWFLYRKMYVYALIYAIGPAMAFYITQDLSADIVWRVIAGGSANYIYFWHAKEQLAKIKSERNTGGETRQQMLGELGGVQPYVVWVGVGLLVLKIGLVVAMFKEGPPGGPKGSPAKPHPASLTHV